MKAGFYQFSPLFGRKDDNFRKVSSAVNGVEMDLLVLPEFFATGYQFVSSDEVAELSEPIPDGNTTSFLLGLAKNRGLYIVAGLPEVDVGSFYNSAVIVGPEGFIGMYRKTHLYYEEKLYFSPGDTGFKVWNTELGRIGIMICFDWFFPESMRTLALMGADVVAHPSNLVLPHCPRSMPVRCLENRVFAVTANRTGLEDRKRGESLAFIGQSQVLSHDGQVLARAEEEEEVIMHADIDTARARDKSLNRLNDLFKDRRPEMYDQLTNDD